MRLSPESLADQSREHPPLGNRSGELEWSLVFREFSSMKKSILIFVCICLATNLARALPGDLDPAFGEGGKVVTDFGNSARVTTLAVHNDGKILAAGNGESGSILLAYYHPNGSLDTSFGNGGKVSTRFGSNTRLNSDCTGSAIDSQGRIVVAGKIGENGNYDYFLAGFDGDGVLDTTFGTNGVIITDVDSQYGPRGPFVQADGKLILTGFRKDYPFAKMLLLRYNADGTLDQSFGQGGIAVTEVDKSRADSFPGEPALQKDGKIVVAYSNMTADRFNSDGTLDKPFYKKMASSSHPSSSYSPVVAIQADGEIVIMGNNHDDSITLSRFSPAGKHIDTTNLKALDLVGALTIDQSGDILASGQVIKDPQAQFAIARFKKSGDPDVTFGKRGVVVTPFGDSFDLSSSIVVLANGKILAAGQTNFPGTERSGFALARYSGVHLQPDLRVGFRKNVPNGENIYDLPGTSQSKTLYSPPGGGIRNLFIGIQNDGTVPDSFKLKGKADNEKLRLNYFRNAKEVTKRVEAGTYLTGKLRPGEIHHLRVQITANLELESSQLPITAVSQTHPNAKDRIWVGAINFE